MAAALSAPAGPTLRRKQRARERRTERPDDAGRLSACDNRGCERNPHNCREHVEELVEIHSAASPSTTMNPVSDFGQT